MSDGLASALGATLICGIPESVKQAIKTGSDPAKLNPATWISGPTIYSTLQLAGLCFPYRTSSPSWYRSE